MNKIANPSRREQLTALVSIISRNMDDREILEAIDPVIDVLVKNMTAGMIEWTLEQWEAEVAHRGWGDCTESTS